MIRLCSMEESMENRATFPRVFRESLYSQYSFLSCDTFSTRQLERDLCYNLDKYKRW